MGLWANKVYPGRTKQSPLTKHHNWVIVVVVEPEFVHQVLTKVVEMPLCDGSTAVDGRSKKTYVSEKGESSH